MRDEVDSRGSLAEPPSHGDSLFSTSFFTACRGVFEGGGMKCAAHAGAYEAALARGVEFVEVAGTSAGSIIAALIGAGADARYLTEQCGRLDPTELLRRPQGVFGYPGARSLSWLGRLWCGRPDSALSLAVAAAVGGRYSSEGIEKWIDERLRELVSNPQGPVRFRDLLLPTSIVAADLSSGAPFVWSSHATPDARVAFAVRCSCSIPIFFEPVKEGTNLYVDGGLLSNLPAFVFHEDHEAHLGRVLAFSLLDEVPPITTWGIGPYLRRLIDTMVSGSSHVQMSLQPSVSRITIPTSGVRATDVSYDQEVVKTLIQSGRDATDKFFRNEASNLRAVAGAEADIMNTDDLYGAIVREAKAMGTTMTVVHQNTEWYWALFPVFARWRSAGAQVRVVLPPIGGSADSALKERQRRRNLESLGATIKEVETFHHRAFILERAGSTSSAFVLNEDTSGLSPVATAYVGARHRQAVKSIIRGVDSALGNACAVPGIVLEALPLDVIVDRLKKGVIQYSGTTVTFELKDVDTQNADLIVNRIRPYKFEQAGFMVSLFQHARVRSFAPACFRCANARETSIITPPVVEVRGGQNVVLEGNSRFYYAYRRGISSVQAIVVCGVDAELPGTPVGIGNVRLAASDSPPRERIGNFDYGNFRSIERAIRPLEDES